MTVMHPDDMPPEGYGSVHGPKRVETLADHRYLSWHWYACALAFVLFGIWSFYSAVTMPAPVMGTVVDSYQVNARGERIASSTDVTPPVSQEQVARGARQSFAELPASREYWETKVSYPTTGSRTVQAVLVDNYSGQFTKRTIGEQIPVRALDDNERIVVRVTGGERIAEEVIAPAFAALIGLILVGVGHYGVRRTYIKRNSA
jgi:hypothetical protein